MAEPIRDTNEKALFAHHTTGLFTMGVPTATAASTGSTDVANALRNTPVAHPRLLFPAGDETKLRERIGADRLLAGVLEGISGQARRMLDVAPITRTQVGRRLLGQSRRFLRRMTTLAFAFRMTSDERFLERARREMMAVAEFSDWNPSHFLDVAEMTAAMAIAYDWLFDHLDAETRRVVRRAIVEKGLDASFQGRMSWVDGDNNWNQVCHCGMVLGALAVQEDEPELAAKVVCRAVEGVPHAMKEYAPDGAYPEGPGYWVYGTSFNVLLIAALESALGTDFGLGDAPGFRQTPYYYLHVTGPTRMFFNCSDCGAHSGITPPMYWFARELNDASLLWYERQKLEEFVTGAAQQNVETGDNRLLPLSLIWAGTLGAVRPPGRLYWSGQGRTPVAMMRSSWDDDATFIGIKGGSAFTNHAHMDAGSFVLDWAGTRWAEDLGAQGYHSLESKGVNLWDRYEASDRWNVFRISAHSHNVLVVNGQNHVVRGHGEIVTARGNASVPRAVVDVSRVYEDQLARASRGAALQSDGSVLIQDEVSTTRKRAKIRWAIVTRADANASRTGGAVLTRDGKRLAMHVLSHRDTEVRTFSTAPKRSYDAENPGTRMVGFELELKPFTTERIAVLFVPGTAPVTRLPMIRPLASW